MMTQRPPQITQDHLGRPAATYIRVSTGPQARDSTGSIAHQRDQQAYAFHWGWGADQVEAYEDLGQSGTRTDGRVAFQRLLTRVAAGHVGAVFAPTPPASPGPARLRNAGGPLPPPSHAARRRGQRP
ncbi:MAG: recombinase family protein [Candidatus Methylomirabilis sp.]|nr:recombinase family protein [Candidatus Methylomirabilis sp.]